jgi:zinc/manganese transport system permease protein
MSTDAVLAFDAWGELQQLFSFHFMQNALLVGTIVAVVAGVVGWFMVLRGQSFAGHTLSQVAFPGASGAALVGVTPAVGLLVFCLLAAVGIALLGGRRSVERRAETAAIGSILAFALALGFLFASLYHGFLGGIQAILFGTFLGISDTQVLMVLVASLLTLVMVAVLGRPLLFASVDPDTAAARGVPVRWLSIGFLVLLGVGVAESAQVTGTLLVFALLVAPAATAQQLTARPAVALPLSVAIALLVSWIGLLIAYSTGYPIGFWVTTVAFAFYLAARGVRVVRAWQGHRGVQMARA